MCIDQTEYNGHDKNSDLKKQSHKLKTGELLEIALDNNRPTYDRENAIENYLKKAKNKVSPTICSQLSKISVTAAEIVEEHLETFRH